VETILRIASVPRLEDSRGETISEVMRAWGAALRVARVASFNKKQANRNQAYRVDIYSKHLSTTSSRARAWVQSIIVQNLVDHNMWSAGAPTTDFVFEWHNAYNDDECVDVSIIEADHAGGEESGDAPTLF